MLYPLKFRPILKERIWGGDKLRTVMGKSFPGGQTIGESWEISGVEGNVSVVNDGFLKDNDLQELTEVYMGELVGDTVYNKYAVEFPVLIKLIDARDVLSIQVHPNDALAAERHNAYGKTEMWYVVDADPDAVLYVGFNRKVTREEYLAAVEAGNLPELLNRIPVRAGDAYFIPAGTIHAIGKGLLIAEIQQTSDVTYRVDDWGRVDAEGNPRELHTELAVGAIDFGNPQDYRVTRQPVRNTVVQLKECPYFTTDILELDGEFERDYSLLDSFVIYMCLSGGFTIFCQGADPVAVTRGESVLIPADFDHVKLEGTATLLEVYIEPN